MMEVIESTFLFVILSILGVSLLKLGYDGVVDFLAERRLKKALQKYKIEERKEDNDEKRV